MHWEELEPIIREPLAQENINLISLIHSGNKKANKQIQQKIEAINQEVGEPIAYLVDGLNLENFINEHPRLKHQLLTTTHTIDLPLRTHMGKIIMAYSQLSLKHTLITAINEKDVFQGLYQRPPVDYDSIYEMGLCSSNQGIKIVNKINSFESAVDGFNILHEAGEHKLLEKILGHTLFSDEDCIKLPQIENFLENNYFIPAYMQSSRVVEDFIYVFSSNISLNDKNIIFYLNNYDNFFQIENKKSYTFLNQVRTLNSNEQLKKDLFYNVRQIIIHNNDSSETIILDETADRDITIIAGHYMENEKAYKALYQIPQYFAGASGDNTLELVLSHGLLPYFQCHDKPQTPTIKVLGQLINDHSGFFEFQTEKYYRNRMYKDQPLLLRLKNIDLKELSELIKKLIPSLVDNYNFYPVLDGIINSIITDIAGEDLKDQEQLEI